MERKLAAILAADVVGFAGLVAQEETATLERVERLRHDVIGMQVGAHRGRVFKAMGDGFLAEFSSTLEAVRCAVAIQRTLALQSARGAEPQLRVRIGVSLDDVVVQGDDLLGTGVANAVRLQSMADPGGLALSAEVMSHVRGRMDLEMVDCGHKKVKETDAPLHVYKSGRSEGAASAGLFDFDPGALKALVVTGGCLCGKIRYEIDMPAISSGYCHCRFCQRFTGSAMSVWTAFPSAGLHLVKGEPRFFASSPIAERGFCPDCGAALFYRLVRPQPAAYVVVFKGSLDAPEQNAPSAHSGVESRMPWLEILDDLPRTTCAESRVLQEAWGSVGLKDPQEWGPGVKPSAPF
ncbi:GFA family protein [Lutimaribacter marinistellae]|uniref:GFA family protein n=1 Tax=Lutimaribacter marinistellae TaxID=1820329 RepID=A0ABV7TKU9_9RHOB